MTIQQFYKLFPLPTPEAELNIMNDTKSIKIADYKVWTTYKVENETLTSMYAVYAALPFTNEEKQTLVFKSKINSLYLKETQQNLSRNLFSLSNQFPIELTENGIRIIALPFNFAFVGQFFEIGGQGITFVYDDPFTYQFKIEQFDMNGILIDEAFSQQNNYEPGDNQKYVFADVIFQIPFDQNFTLLSATKTIKITITSSNNRVNNLNTTFNMEAQWKNF